MIAYVKGRVTDIGVSTVTVESGGLGYELNVSFFCARACNAGEEVKLPAYLHVNDTGVTLYGFTDRAEKDMFLKLTSVSGVGAKMALAVLSGMTVTDLVASIARGDTGSIGKIKGIGKKTAERITLELRDKIAKEIKELDACGAPVSDIVPVDEEAVMALMALGFNKNEAIAAVGRVQGENLTPEQIVFKALKG